MVTVEVDPVHVESRLVGGAIACPACLDGVLAGWGYARARHVEGLDDPVRPRRARCRSCLVTHVLLRVTMLLRRAYAAERIWIALSARAEGIGHRGIAARLQVPPATVRGWLRRAGQRLESMRTWFVTVAVRTGIDVTIPDGLGCGWRDAEAAVMVAASAVGQRFGPAGLLGVVTPAQVMVAVSGARLLAPGWPPMSSAVPCNTSCP
ncbi:helix-turn-helix domain-containing protein [Mycolicibacterium sp. jd]|uniref:Helix-turn-helix domain-containing protein n=1 Tax=Mycolicibacterium austroafricanum TaxID=39687 RepID=A0ABT8HE49_MYCAO|nr:MULTISPECIES: helix-turn-helix domain-containing protein [Mycolicibacterium]MDN4519044.1 helix-turn-helix domain-containing protein [Mycolicibacterium austroafricanum]UJL30607.1 helix-turn-helix domain-containing protein [Mycolicibacterium vanbaalenii]